MVGRLHETLWTPGGIGWPRGIGVNGMAGRGLSRESVGLAKQYVTVLRMLFVQLRIAS
jgi:hypothetical protein